MVHGRDAVTLCWRGSTVAFGIWFMLFAVLFATTADVVADEPFHSRIAQQAERSVQAGRLGEFTATFTERSPLSSIQIFAARFGWGLAQIRERDPRGGEYDLADETFGVYVPQDYSPDEPYGLFVWLSPGDQGGLPPGLKSELKKVLDWHRLIWIGANNAGNDRPIWNREGLAIDAVHNMKQLYTIDEQRVYAAGLSGGGRCASGVAVVYPELFHGGFYMMGCNYFRRLAVPDQPKYYYASHYRPPSREVLKLIKKRNRYVLLTGEHDSNRVETHAIHAAYEADGFEHATYIEIPDLGHTLPGPKWFDEGIVLLDAPLFAVPDVQDE